MCLAFVPYLTNNWWISSPPGEISQEEFSEKVGQLETMNTDWFDLLTRNAFNQQHSIGFSGGAGKTSYYASPSASPIAKVHSREMMYRIIQAG